MAKVSPSGAAAPTAEKKEKKAKHPKADYFGKGQGGEGINKKDPAQYPLTASTPPGFDHGKNKPLSKKDFAKPSLYLRYKGDHAKFVADRFYSRADEVAKAGDKKGGDSKVKRLKKLQDKMEQLKKELLEQGIPLEAIQGAAA